MLDQSEELFLAYLKDNAGSNAKYVARILMQPDWARPMNSD